MSESQGVTLNPFFGDSVNDGNQTNHQVIKVDFEKTDVEDKKKVGSG